jgi:CubicO group peptidase (beta-lactamase class C family)
MNTYALRSHLELEFLLLLTLTSCLGLGGGMPSAAAEPSPTKTSILAPKLQHYVNDQVMAGAVLLVADKDNILDLEALGWSDVEAKKPMRVDDVFWIASMTKSVTAAALMMLVDEGRVRVDDPVEKYIPGFSALKVRQSDGTLVPPSHPITIREILSHTSGMRFLNSKDRNVIDSVPLTTSIEHDLLEPLLSDPGTKYQYSNEGIDTAGRIIEIVSGLPYDRFLQERLFAPLGMADTTFWPSASQIRRMAKTYKAGADKKSLVETHTSYMTYPLDKPERYAAPGGGLFSTARDVSRFCQMLLNGGTLDGRKYLSSESVHQMTTKQTGPKVADGYGFGLSGSADGQSFGHGGALKTDMAVDRGQIRVFLVQHDGDWSGGDPNNDFNDLARKSFAQAHADSRDDASPWGMAAGAGEMGYYAKCTPTLRQAGVRWLRLFPEWQNIEPKQGQWNWEASDKLVAKADQSGK